MYLPRIGVAHLFAGKESLLEQILGLVDGEDEDVDIGKSRFGCLRKPHRPLLGIFVDEYRQLEKADELDDREYDPADPGDGIRGESESQSPDRVYEQAYCGGYYEQPVFLILLQGYCFLSGAA